MVAVRRHGIERDSFFNMTNGLDTQTPKCSVILHESLHLPRVQVPHTKSEIIEQNNF